MNERRETLYDKLDSFGIFSNDTQKLFNNMADFYFEAIGAKDENFKDIGTTKIQNGVGNTIQFLDGYRRTYYKNTFSSAILIFVIWYHLSLMRWKKWLQK